MAVSGITLPSGVNIWVIRSFRPRIALTICLLSPGSKVLSQHAHLLAVPTGSERPSFWGSSPEYPPAVYVPGFQTARVIFYPRVESAVLYTLISGSAKESDR